MLVDNIHSGGSFPSYGGSPSVDNGCYAIESIESGTVTFRNPYYMAAGVLCSGPDSCPASGIVALKLENSGSTAPGVSIVSYASVSQLQQEQLDDRSTCIIPLYKFDGNHAVECDFRSAPVAVMWEGY